MADYSFDGGELAGLLGFTHGREEERGVKRKIESVVGVVGGGDGGGSGDGGVGRGAGEKLLE